MTAADTVGIDKALDSRYPLSYQGWQTLNTSYR